MLSAHQNQPARLSPAICIKAARNFVAQAREENYPRPHIEAHLIATNAKFVDCLDDYELEDRIELSQQYNAIICDYNQFVLDRASRRQHYQHDFLNLIILPRNEIDTKIRNSTTRKTATVLGNTFDPASIRSAVTDLLDYPSVWQARLPLYRKEILRDLVCAYQQTEDQWSDLQKLFFKANMARLCADHNNPKLAPQPIDGRDQLDINALLPGAVLCHVVGRKTLQKEGGVKSKPPLPGQKKCEYCGREFHWRGLGLHRKACARISRSAAANKDTVPTRRDDQGSRPVCPFPEQCEYCQTIADEVNDGDDEEEDEEDDEEEIRTAADMLLMRVATALDE